MPSARRKSVQDRKKLLAIESCTTPFGPITTVGRSQLEMMAEALDKTQQIFQLTVQQWHLPQLG